MKQSFCVENFSRFYFSGFLSLQVRSLKNSANGAFIQGNQGSQRIFRVCSFTLLIFSFQLRGPQSKNQKIKLVPTPISQKFPQAVTKIPIPKIPKLPSNPSLFTPCKTNMGPNKLHPGLNLVLATRVSPSPLWASSLQSSNVIKEKPAQFYKTSIK